MQVKALLHGGPLDDSWWCLDDNAEPPKYLMPQEGLGAGALPVLFAGYAIPVQGWRYELATTDDHRVVYVWAQDQRPPFEFIAVVEDGPAEGYRMDVLGLTEPWPWLRLVRRPQTGVLDGGHMEWMHIPWPDGAEWPEECWYELTGTIIPPGQIAEAHYRLRPAPNLQLRRIDE